MPPNEDGTLARTMSNHSPEDSASRSINVRRSPSHELHSRRSTFKLPVFLITICLILAVFLVALDTTILATAIPKITDDFNSLTDVGWYAGVYALTSAIFQLLYGNFFKIFSAKWTFVSASIVFEIGSILCAAAPSSPVLILGRAFAGVGSAGIFAGAFIIVSHTVPLRWRPIYNSIFGALYGIASVVGPVIGGLLTDKITWRWCFWINVPIGVVTVIVVSFVFEPPSGLGPDRQPHPHSDHRSPATVLQELNVLSTILLISSTIPLLLALQWGGMEYSWSNSRVITLFIVAGASTVLFILLQIRQGEKAFLPIQLIKQRTLLACCWFTFTAGSSVAIVIYYLPIWFQAVLGVSALQSGFLNLPFVISLVCGSLVSGVITSTTGNYVQLLILSSVVRAIGTGLLTTLKPSSQRWQYVFYQIIFGLGDGCGMQQPLIAVQNAIDSHDVAMAISVLIFCQTLGSSVFIVVGQSILTNRLTSLLDGILPSGPITTRVLLESGATSFRALGLDQEVLSRVVSAYSGAVTDTFYVAVALSCASLVGACTVEWKKIKIHSDDEPIPPVNTATLGTSTATNTEDRELSVLGPQRRISAIPG
ncbi:hypothetical protein LTR84_005470 [Exophiala bonariae]|uniref:Major facilitator superfamily (MFS) profile domain-containing protein n=1 Tax=Exophiala bonariae TaxID=1690606 RepID=A0AAV9N523_9EURO|nr:hypothetical protein LTR84_005470 [Exophiala bonariae]